MLPSCGFKPVRALPEGRGALGEGARHFPHGRAGALGCGSSEEPRPAPGVSPRTGGTEE